MNRKVAVLPETLANQIAAGEVVERPASVVKELVENAIDAGATRIFVDLEGAGRALIRIVDDGEGMSAADAQTAVLRHATSKIRTVDDLAAIGTLGFRGEALPSIASVSRFTLVTRRDEDEVATRLDIIGGGNAAVSALGAPIGTRLEVRDLFYNVPARLKFLKADATEQGHVADLVRAFALGYPQLHFRLTVGTRVVAEYAPARRLGERVHLVLGKEAGKGLYEVVLDGAQVGVTGFVSSPQAAKSTAAHLYTYVNGRRVKDRTLTHAVLSAYGADLQPGRFPLAVLYLHLDPSAVDVNVHPTKAEVRFAEAGIVHEALGRAIRATLAQRPWLTSDPLPLEALGAGPQALQAGQTGLARVSEAARTYRSGAQAGFLPEVAPHPTELRFGPPVTARMVPYAAFPAATAPYPFAPRSWPAGATPPGPHATAPADPSPDATPNTAPATRFIGTCGAGLGLFEGPNGDLVALALALAHADVLNAQRPSATRPLLMPKVFEPPSLALGALLAHADTGARLTELGLWVERFGGRAWQILGVPTLTPNAAPDALLTAVLTALEARRDPALALVDTEAAADPMLCTPTISEATARRLWDAWHALPPAARRPALARWTQADIGARLRHG